MKSDKQIKIKTGFTLVELLVVISIIALLLSILMPVLNKARETAYSMICMSNLRSIGLAADMYASENNGEFPPVRMFTKSPTNTDPYVNEYGRERPRWQWFFDYGIGPVIDPSPYVSDSGDTFGDSDTLIMTNDYFMCPSFNRPGFEARDIRNGSYGYNYHYLGNSRISDGKYRNFPVKRSVITRISETVLVADSRGILPEGIHGYTLDPPKLPRSVGGETFARWLKPTLQGQHSPADARHNGNVNVVFLDSHVEKMTLEDLGYVRDNKEVVIADHPDGSNCFWSGGQGRE